LRHGIGSSVSGRKRHGNVLVLFAILLFGIFAMATLVIDLGIVRVTLQQMQTAADSAALEGLRFRDEALIADGNAPTDGGIDDIAADNRWRAKASDWVARVYSEDSDTPRQANFGSTQTLEFSGGFGDPQMFASQDIRVNPQAYSPSELHALQLNFANDPDGDIYARSDDVLEVRLRRTGELPVADIRSSGPRLPFVFGRGTMLYRPGELRQPIGDGVGLQATGVARVAPAVAVGRENLPHDDWPRALNVAVSEENWHALNGTYLSDYTLTDHRLYFLGQSVELDEEPDEADTAELACDCDNLSFGYVGITAIINDVERVIGFGLVAVEHDADAEAEDNSSEPKNYTFRPLYRDDDRDDVVGLNASASFASAWGRLTSAEREDLAPFVSDLISRNRDLRDGPIPVVLAPVSERQPS